MRARAADAKCILEKFISQIDDCRYRVGGVVGDGGGESCAKAAAEEA